MQPETTSTPSKRLLNRVEVRERWGVSDSTLARLVRRGELVGVKIGRSVRFPEAEVDALVARLPRTAPARG